MANSIEPAKKSEVEEWVKWSLTLTHTPEQKDPFDPSDGGANWNRKQTGSVIFLAALAATETPPDQPSDSDDSTAGDGDVVYHHDDGSARPGGPPHVVLRTITISNNKDILIPVLTEAACKVKYKKVKDLNKLAKKINRKDGEIPSLSIEFDNLDDRLPPEKYSESDLKSFHQEGNTRVDIPRHNVFHQPAGTDKVEYDCYCAKLKRTALGSRNSLKFSGGSKKYSYKVEYMINVR
jgi:hypothetical protein